MTHVPHDCTDLDVLNAASQEDLQISPDVDDCAAPASSYPSSTRLLESNTVDGSSDVSTFEDPHDGDKPNVNGQSAVTTTSVFELPHENKPDTSSDSEISSRPLFESAVPEYSLPYAVKIHSPNSPYDWSVLKDLLVSNHDR
ncbi:hypothetical protein QJS10_CPB22g00797 [Acorus calamus]|uniref:Uncharacterized protein n=1 Tax=Acorus calamus TaxID=4465 RepID=A0AAV9BZD7_ACOCL|nr:hypothetical protein QJS10_CPB22g00797 [Acorus calamus]